MSDEADEAVLAALGKWKHARPGQIAREVGMSTQAVTAALYRNHDKVHRNAGGWWSGRLKAHVMVPAARLAAAEARVARLEAALKDAAKFLERVQTGDLRPGRSLLAVWYRCNAALAAAASSAEPEGGDQ